VHDQGKAVQVNPIIPTLKPPGTTRWKLKYIRLLSNVAFEFNLRRYTKEGNARLWAAVRGAIEVEPARPGFLPKVGTT